MRVLHLATTDAGGAGNAASRVHEAMQRHGVESVLLLWDKQSDRPGLVQLHHRAGGVARRFVARVLSRFATDRRYFFQDQSARAIDGTDLIDHARRFRPDLIVAHQISAFAAFGDLAALQRETGARIVYNLMDMAHLTGGCHYAWACSGYTRSCRDCPALPNIVKRDLAANTLRAKRHALVGTDHAVVAGSATLREQARASSLFANADIRTILMGIDPEAFPFGARADARLDLGLPVTGDLLLIGAQRLSDTRKGMQELSDALMMMDAALPTDAPRPGLLVAGHDSGLFDRHEPAFRVHRLGYVDTTTLARAYTAADVFVCPSIEDSGPMMINESIMAGTPVVAFDMGVAPDLIVDGETGLIAKAKSADALGQAILTALSWDDAYRRLVRERCRALAERACSVTAQVEAFLAIARPDGAA